MTKRDSRTNNSSSGNYAAVGVESLIEQPADKRKTYRFNQLQIASCQKTVTVVSICLHYEIRVHQQADCPAASSQQAFLQVSQRMGQNNQALSSF